MKYFEGITILDDLKKEYKILCKRYHPDLNIVDDTTKIMQEINNEYDLMLLIVEHKGEKLSDDDIVIEKELKEIIKKVSHLEGIIVELCGRWIWLTGNTYTFKTYIKELGFFWAKKKLAWYWRPEDAKCFSKKKLTLQEIRLKYGTQTFGKHGSALLLS